MSISHPLLSRTMQPEALGMVQGVFRRIKAEGHLSRSEQKQQAFAAYLLRMYFRGMVIEESLYKLGVAAAKARVPDFGAEAPRDVHLPLTRVLIVEDDYLLATDLKKMFQKAGATVIGPIGRESEALSLLDTEVPDLAIIDLNLGDGASFKVAEHLTHQSVPVCVFSAYKRSQFKEIPESLKRAPWLEKANPPQALLKVAESLLG